LLFGAYRRPRELNWMVGLLLFGVVAVFALSGYLLPWDQKGYWAKLVEATITGSAPVVGTSAQKFIQGGTTFGNTTLTRAYALHAMALPALLTGLLVFHIYLFRRHGGKVVFFGRFIALLRIFAGPLAGALRMSYPKFLAANATGGLIWAGGTTAVVYYLGLAAERWLSRFSWVALVVAIVIGIGMTLLLRERTARLIRDLDEEHDWDTLRAP